MHYNTVIQQVVKLFLRATNSEFKIRSLNIIYLELECIIDFTL